MPYRSSTLFEEKPYNRCVDCIHLGVRCDGPNFFAMDIQRLSEWARLRKDYLHHKDFKWTNQYIAMQADVSYTTVSRFMVGDLDDIKFSTAAAIIRVLVNGTWGQYPCALASGEIDYEPECQRLKELLDAERAKTEYLKKQVEFKENQMIEKDNTIRMLLVRQ